MISTQEIFRSGLSIKCMKSKSQERKEFMWHCRRQNLAGRIDAQPLMWRKYFEKETVGPLFFTLKFSM